MEEAFVSALVEACQEYGEEEIGETEFLQFLRGSRDGVEALLDRAGSYGLDQQAAEFEEAMQRLEDALLDRDGPAIRAHMTTLRDLALLLEAGTQEEGEGSLLDYVHDRGLAGLFGSSFGSLPSNFRRLVKMGKDYLEGDVPKDTFLQAVAQLEMTVRTSRRSMEHRVPKTTPEALPYLDYMRRGIQLTLDALESLRLVADRRDHRAIAAAQSAFDDANEQFRVVKEAPE